MDELHVLARRVLLDALEALGEHRDATILVGLGDHPKAAIGDQLKTGQRA